MLPGRPSSCDPPHLRPPGPRAAALLVLLAPPAAAHVEVGPETAVAGSETTLTFSFHHGKDGAATTALQVQLPDGAEVVSVPAVAGWTSSVDGRGHVDGRPGARRDRAEFPIVVRLPGHRRHRAVPDGAVTEAGELAWISPDEGEGEDQHPAPRVVPHGRPGRRRVDHDDDRAVVGHHARPAPHHGGGRSARRRQHGLGAVDHRVGRRRPRRDPDRWNDPQAPPELNHPEPAMPG